jgi:hypothetical protein
MNVPQVTNPVAQKRSAVSLAVWPAMIWAVRKANPAGPL